MSFWKEQTKLRNVIKRQEDALGTRQAVVTPVRDMTFAWERQHAAEVAAELERQRVASEREQARRTAMAEAEQVRQRQWAEQRNVLRDRVVGLERALSGAEGRMQGADLDDCVRAAGEAAVYRVQLQAAQQAYASHLKPQGYIPHASRSPL